MSSNKVVTLAQAIPPPAHPLDWNEWMLERNLRILSIKQFPEDFVDFGRIYGSGVFKAFYTWEVWSPARANYPSIVLNFARRTNKFKDAAGVNDVPFGIFPDVGGFLPFASTPDGDYVGWITAGKADEWKVVDLSRYSTGMYQSYDGGFSGYLYDVLSRKLHLDRHQGGKDWTLGDVAFEQTVFEDREFDVDLIEKDAKSRE